MKIEITGDVDSRTYGQNTYHSQEAFIHKDGQKYPEKTQISVRSKERSYAQGFYLIDFNQSVTTGQYDRMEFARYPVLTPVKQ